MYNTLFFSLFLIYFFHTYIFFFTNFFIEITCRHLFINVFKNIYPIIGLKYNTTGKNVERSIRNAIDISWLRANWDLMEEIFGYSIDQNRAKPTSKEYITSIVEYIKNNGIYMDE